MHHVRALRMCPRQDDVRGRQRHLAMRMNVEGFRLDLVLAYEEEEEVKEEEGRGGGRDEKARHDGRECARDTMQPRNRSWAMGIDRGPNATVLHSASPSTNSSPNLVTHLLPTRFKMDVISITDQECISVTSHHAQSESEAYIDFENDKKQLNSRTCATSLAGYHDIYYYTPISAKVFCGIKTWVAVIADPILRGFLLVGGRVIVEGHGYGHSLRQFVAN